MHKDCNICNNRANSDNPIEYRHPKARFYLEGNFDECGRGKPDFPVALELSLAVTRFAGGLPVGLGVVGVEFAAGSGPNAAAP